MLEESLPPPPPPPVLLEEEEVVVEASLDSGSSRLEDIYTLLAEGRYPRSMNPVRKKNLRRYSQKFLMDGECHPAGVFT